MVSKTILDKWGEGAPPQFPKNAEDNYGVEIILDLHNCDVSKFNRKDIDRFLEELCNLIDIKRAVLHWWDYEGQAEKYESDSKTDPHLVGTSCVQFIQTSAIVIHTIDPWKKIFINIFSCKTFDPDLARYFATEYFSGEVATFQKMVRR